ncbi:MAG: hypothetical protein KKA07_16020 [Bacteroidetes bacterium]|nr:hypothetical protein [Bacteroidota bacterium]MBU1720571.1 hypothetical protein [Bacteroidota bacterium]
MIRVCFGILLLGLLQGCQIMDPDPVIPSYIHVGNPTFVSSANEGSCTHGISDVWVYVDDQVVGGFELPATIPIISDGSVDLVLKAGVKLNGIASTRAIYPFYSPIQFTQSLIKDSVFEINPVFTYYPTVTFEMIEDFEKPGNNFELLSSSQVPIQVAVIPEDPFNGEHYGSISLTSQDSLFDCKTIGEYVLPMDGSPVFVEIDYRCSNVFTVSLLMNYSSYSTRSEILNINTRDTWNKLYLNLTNIVIRDLNVRSFSLVFSAMHEGDEDTWIHLDNVKILH